MLNGIYIAIFLGVNLFSIEVYSQNNSDSMQVFDINTTSVLFKDHPISLLVDTSEAIQILARLINNDYYNSLFLNPNRNRKGSEDGFDFNRTQNFNGIFKGNKYTLKSNHMGGFRVNYWYTGGSPVNLSRNVNIHF